MRSLKSSRRQRRIFLNLPLNHAPGAPERDLAGKHLVENDPQAVKVAAGIDPMGLAPSLLGRHVRQGPEQFPLDGHRDLIGFPSGQAEIGQMRLLVLVDQDIRRLDIAMDDALSMRMIAAHRQRGPRARRSRGM